MKGSRLSILSSIGTVCLFLVSCKEKKEAGIPGSFSYVVKDSMEAWCKNKLFQNRVSHEGNTINLLFFEEELNALWKPGYREEAVNELASNADFEWKELPAHEGNRQWELSLPLQVEDSTYCIPNNLLLYLFR